MEGIIEDFDRKLGQGFTSANILEEIDIRPGYRSCPTIISTKLNPDHKSSLVTLLKEYKDCFVREYQEMLGLSHLLVEHRLLIKEGYCPFKQPPCRFHHRTHKAIKAEITRLYDASFIRPCRYMEWVSNIVLIEKKNGKLWACIEFRDLNKVTPKDEYPMPVTDMLVDAMLDHKVTSFMDGNVGYNKIFMVEQDISKTTF